MWNIANKRSTLELSAAPSTLVSLMMPNWSSRAATISAPQPWVDVGMI